MSTWGGAFGGAWGGAFNPSAPLAASTGDAWGRSFGGAWGGSFGALAEAASGPGVVLFPRGKLTFRTKADLALYGLAIYAKDAAVKARSSFEPLFPLRTVSYRDAIRV